MLVKESIILSREKRPAQGNLPSDSCLELLSLCGIVQSALAGFTLVPLQVQSVPLLSGSGLAVWMAACALQHYLSIFVKGC